MSPPCHEKRDFVDLRSVKNLFFQFQIGSLSWSILPGKVLFRDVLYMTPDFRLVTNLQYDFFFFGIVSFGGFQYDGITRAFTEMTFF